MSERALYVYGVVPGTAPRSLFDDVRGVDPSEPVTLVADGDVAAVASAVRLDEFGEAAIEDNLRDPGWLADKARAHDAVLAAAVGRTTVLPFRFGAIYRNEDHILELLRERADFASALRRLEGAVELGVKGFVDVGALAERLAADRSAGEETSAGRAYMQRKQEARRLDEDVELFVAERAQETHDRLAAVARDAHVNALQPGERRMILNGAYLVADDEEARFRDELADVARAHEQDRIDYELNGPWPPYNFAGDEDQA
ncbi:MAG: GvpL/GvpF family gas vesicle protein [Actinobacteria bacterium]|nr:MAG: GvpL/GvpF family gas vesicle protein [Actinomycetota bacterium]